MEKYIDKIQYTYIPIKLCECSTIKGYSGQLFNNIIIRVLNKHKNKPFDKILSNKINGLEIHFSIINFTKDKIPIVKIKDLENIIEEFEKQKTQTENKIDSHHRIIFGDAINIKNLPKETIDLVITSPPYWSIKDYGNKDQLGFNDSLDEYMKKLCNIFRYCLNVLKPNSKLCINIGNQFLKASIPPKKVYQIIPLHAMLIESLMSNLGDELVYLGSIHWKKITNSKTSGGGQIMGSYPYPKSGYFFNNREFIAIFRKLGIVKKCFKPKPQFKKFSRLTLEEWRIYFKDEWKMNPSNQDSHIAMFPDELPKRLIKMYSFVGDTVLDPFLGSGTTSKMASKLGRNSIGYEIGFETKNKIDWIELIKSKIQIQDSVLEYPYQIMIDDKKVIKTKKISVSNKYSFLNINDKTKCQELD